MVPQRFVHRLCLLIEAKAIFLLAKKLRFFCQRDCRLPVWNFCALRKNYARSSLQSLWQKKRSFFASKKIAFVSPKRQRRKINLCGTTLVAAPRRPLRPTIRGRGLITALRRPCLLRAFSRSAGSSGVIFAADPVSASHQTGGSLGTDSLGLLIPILAFALYCLSFYHKSRFCQQENYTIPK